MKINQSIKTTKKKSNYFMLNTTNERYFVFGVFSFKINISKVIRQNENNKWSHKK